MQNIFEKPWDDVVIAQKLKELEECKVVQTEVSVGGKDTIESQLLAYRYHPDMCSYIGTTFLESSDRKFKLVVVDKKRYFVSEEAETGKASMMLFPDDLMYNSKIACWVAETIAVMDDRKAKHEELMHDTKNYGCRVNAMIKDGRLFLHAESYNNNVTENGEYYQLERTLGAYSLSISDSSVFMKRYLGEDYTKYYTEKSDQAILKLTSFEELETQCLLEDHNNKNGIWKERLQYFHIMRAELEKLYADLKDERVFVGYPRCEVTVEDLLEFYGLKEDFNCEIVRMDKVFELTNKECKDGMPEKFKISNCEVFKPRSQSFLYENDVEITLEDLYRALELGISKVENVATMKKLGDLDSALSLF